MGKRINTGFIVDPNVQQPWTGPSLDFVQDWNEESLAATLRAMIGFNWQSGVPYAIIGCEWAGNVNTPSSVNAGYIFYANKLYRCPGYATVSTGATIVLTTVSTGNLEYTDGSFKNPFDTVTADIVDQTLGTGTFNLNAVVYLDQPYNWIAATLLNSWVSVSSPRYRRVKDEVQLTGTISAASNTIAAQVIMTLPSGDRPVTDVILPIAVLNGATYVITEVSVIASTGNVSINATGLTNTLTLVYLPAIRFFTS